MTPPVFTVNTNRDFACSARPKGSTWMHVIQYSGGIGSWATAQRVAAQHGTSRMVLLYTDTRVEEQSLYTFVAESAAQLRVPLVTVADGRTPFEVYWDVRFLGNSRLAPCSKL